MVNEPWFDYMVLSWTSHTGEMERSPEVKKNIDSIDILLNYLHALFARLRGHVTFED